MSLIDIVEQAEQQLAKAEHDLHQAEQQLGAPGISWEVAVQDLTHAQAKANLAAAKLMGIAARVQVTTRHDT